MTIPAIETVVTLPLSWFILLIIVIAVLAYVKGIQQGTNNARDVMNGQPPQQPRSYHIRR